MSPGFPPPPTQIFNKLYCLLLSQWNFHFSFSVSHHFLMKSCFFRAELLWLIYSCQFVQLYIKPQIILSPISLLLCLFLWHLLSSMTGHISFIHMTIAGGIFPSTWKLITASSAFLYYHIVHNTKFVSTTQKPIYHKVDSLAYGGNCVAHNDILYRHIVRER